MEISFSKAIRLVHPDTNNNIEDAGTKVKTIMALKNEPSKMYYCLKQWGLLNAEVKTKVIWEYFKYLKKNHIYNNVEVVIYHKKYGRLRVYKTTSKRVYFTPDVVKNKGIHYCLFKSVRGAFYKKIVKE